MKHSSQSRFENVSLLVIAFVSAIFLSPKWMLSVAAWIHFAVLLRFYRMNRWKGFLLSIPVLTLASILANDGIIPMDFVSMCIFLLISTSIGLIPYVLDRITYRHLPEWGRILFFPTAFTLFNYFMDQGPQGTWGNNAYTQFEWLTLMQITSITGIYGIDFLLYWFASFVNELWEKRGEVRGISPFAWAMPVCLSLILLFGIVRLNSESASKGAGKMATITMDNLGVAKNMYEVAFGKQIEIPKDISQSDPRLAELQKGMLAFMENPDAPKFEQVYKQMDEMLHKYIEATRTAAEQGAKIITWSEAAIVNLKSREASYQQQVAALADELDVYLFFPTAVFHAEKVGKEANFIENKVLAFGPDGELLNTYFKNIPVMGIEPSFPGDGVIPVIPTSFGNLSPIICYDADHPTLIDQISGQGTDLLVVPTGDWYAISPYHTYMAAVRCIEHGVSMLKSTSNGLSAMIDDKGRIVASYDFFDEEEVKMMVQHLEVKTSKTLYGKSFPLFLLFLLGCAVGLGIWAVGNWAVGKWRKGKTKIGVHS